MSDDLDLRCAPDDPEGLRAEIARRDKIITALMNQVQRNLNSADNTFALLQTSFILEEQVRHRTAELEQAKREVELARDTMSAAISGISEGLALFDRDDRLRLCNDVYLKLWGLSRDLMGSTLEEILRHLAMRRGMVNAAWIERRLARHRAASGTSEYRLPGGQYIQVRERKTADGGTVAIYTDITETTEAKERVLLAAVNNIDQGLTMFDAELHLVVWNRRFLELLEMPEDVVAKGMTFEDMLRFNVARGEYGPVDCEAMVAERMERARRGEAHRYERRRPNGTVLEIVGRPLPGGGFVSTYSDISERVADAQAMREKTAQLIQSNADLERFAFAASHDLRTPLRNIVSYAQLLERRYRGALDADADTFIGFIVDNGRHMTQLVTDLLAYSVVAAQTIPLLPVSASEAAARAVSNLRTDIEEAGAEIQVETLPVVMADRANLVSLFQNLLSNSLKYRSPDRPLRLAVTARRQTQGQWRFAVSDNGIGIDPSYFDKIFDIFQRLSPTTGVKGTGIGLALCRRIVDRFGGTIWVESEPGRGATFCFTLRDAASASGEDRE